MNMLEDLKMSLLNFSFAKMLVLLINYLNYLKIIFSNTYLRNVVDVLFFYEKTYNDRKSKTWSRKHN